MGVQVKVPVGAARGNVMEVAARGRGVVLVVRGRGVVVAA